MAEVIRMDSGRLKGRQISRIVDALRDGGVIIYPTDTIYGLGCDFSQRGPIERIRQIKGRDSKKPMSFVCSNLTHVSRYANVSNFAYCILQRFLPGPYTFVLSGTKETPHIVLSKHNTVGIRIPDHPLPLTLVSEFGQPIISTSANRTDEDVHADPGELVAEFNDATDIIIDCGLLPIQPSTVVSLVDDRVEILREGGGDLEFFRQQAQESS